MGIKINELKKYLNDKSHDELKAEILDLFKMSADVKEYYFLKVKPNAEEEMMKKYKKIISDQFFPPRGNGFPDYKVLRKAISDFKKISQNPRCLADLMMTYVEKGVEFTNCFGDIDEKFYYNVANMYEDVLALILHNNLENEFKDRCRKAMEDSSHIGWGFGMVMEDQYYNSLGIDEDEE